MLILSIIGKSKSGKTTLIEKLIPELKSRGLRVGTIKHAHHGFEIDHPGKDSFRHREAGAEIVVLSSKDKIAIQKNIQKEVPLNEIIQTYFPDNLDVVLVEGYKSERATNKERTLASAAETVRRPDQQALKIEVEGVKDIDIKGIADFIIQASQARDGSGAKAKSVPYAVDKGTLSRLASEPSLSIRRH